MSESGKRVAVFGAGYVGLVTGACFAELGHQVVVRDVVAEKIETLRRGDVPIYEAGLDELLERNRERLAFTTDVNEAMDSAEFVYVAVGTPPTYSGDADLSAVWTVIDELPAVDRRIVVCMKSTVPVGTGEKVRHRLDARGLGHVGYVSNPEFTAEGTAVRDFMEPDRIVVGLDLKILLMTGIKVLRRENISPDGQVTMPRFDQRAEQAAAPEAVHGAARDGELALQAAGWRVKRVHDRTRDAR